MVDEMTIRATTTEDLSDVDALLQASYPVLLKADYAPSVLVTCLPLITRAQPELLRCGTYYIAEGPDGPLAAGGWTHGAPQGGVGPRDVGHIRHVVTHPKALRRGLARSLIERSFRAARTSGVRWMMCQSTRTAEPFYASMGFQRRGEIDVRLRPGISFPAVEMIRPL
ncbi:GNAT family N-acetyltransferase [Gymnodinialimonas ceratoperidinii]|uniref:GNAT family N-acetyltransferase n=1 Tax=Gymnodinialimonas ceratoperidinii TaxID=2856823 RepID=A0A8F6YCE9_9RHOB|nr:GNAT family N-acetyltransferase [Gymnodinialimonas ceratoperidinii]QXT39142.1 GNAT family N-acetyltransferase [Gymnodinialimonas ceratoperidinii]